MIRNLLPYLFRTVAICLVFALAAWLALKWIAVRIARRVAALAEARIAAQVQAGLSRSGVRFPVVNDELRRATYLHQIDRMAHVMDRLIPLPIVGGIGLDALLGLVPGIGDVLSFAISSFIVIRAAELGVPESLISRLVAIQMTDLVLGALPIAGDIFDVAYHADEKSAALIREFVQTQVKASAPSARGQAPS
jgi:hypothetical protein